MLRSQHPLQSAAPAANPSQTNSFSRGPLARQAASPTVGPPHPHRASPTAAQTPGYLQRHPLSSQSAPGTYGRTPSAAGSRYPQCRPDARDLRQQPPPPPPPQPPAGAGPGPLGPPVPPSPATGSRPPGAPSGGRPSPPPRGGPWRAGRLRTPGRAGPPPPLGTAAPRTAPVPPRGSARPR